jgi:hypothetical protein
MELHQLEYFVAVAEEASFPRLAPVARDAGAAALAANGPAALAEGPYGPIA